MSLYLNDEKILNNFKHNANLFSMRFPDLAKTIGLDSKSNHTLLKEIPDNYILQRCKKNTQANTLLINNRYLHSRYDSTKEAHKLSTDIFFQTATNKKKCVFLGVGLGYIPEIFVSKNKNAMVILIEPDVYSFLLFLTERKLDTLLLHQNLVFLLGVAPNDAFNFLVTTGNKKTPWFNNKAVQQSCPEWYLEFETIVKRNRIKDNINSNTAQKFSKLWLRNICKNINHFSSMHGISIFKNEFPNTVAIVLAAGPSLDKQLQKLSEKKHNHLIIAVDTALKACIKFGITPHFLITGDPQFWNYLHIAGYELPNTVLVAETTVFPSSLRLNTKATIIYTHKTPLTKYYKNLSPEIEVLDSGGSIATTAWSLAKFLGSTTIIMMGLDLAYPNKQTHFRGSTFEEKVHTTSNTIATAELATTRSLISAQPEFAKTYSDEAVLTDSRLKMYAWWFESKIAQTDNITTYNFLSNGVKIPGIPILTNEDFKKITSQPAFDHTKIDKLLELEIPKNPIAQNKIFSELLSDLEYIQKTLPELENTAYDENITASKYSILEEIPIYTMLENNNTPNFHKTAQICKELHQIIKKYL